MTSLQKRMFRFIGVEVKIRLSHLSKVVLLYFTVQNGSIQFFLQALHAFCVPCYFICLL